MKRAERFLFLNSSSALLATLFVFWACFAYGDVKVVGYYPEWLRSTIPAEKIEFQNLTQINYSFAWPNASGTISAPYGFKYPKLIELAHTAGVKVLLTLGGWGHSDGFSPMAADSSKRAVFINNLITYCDNNGYDGVDIDWEYPANETDRANLNLLIKELREAFDDYDEDWLITMAVSAGSWAGQWFDYNVLKNYVDWFGCMTYDFFGSWVDKAGHNSPLYPPAQNDNGSVQAGMWYLNRTRNVPKEKILIGIPFYGRGCNAKGYNMPNTGGDVEYYYSQIVPLIGNGWTYHWDNVAKVPYLINADSTKFITFDDTMSVRLKCEYAKEENLAGVMIWALGQDVIGNTQPLLKTVGKAMGLTTEVLALEKHNPDSFILLNNYPNPFNAQTVISYYLPREENVRIEIFNILGERVAVLSQGVQSPGWHYVRFDSQGVSSGEYICRLLTPFFSKTVKMTVLK